MARAFDGLRVLDLTHVLAGPFCTYQLAVMGADVIKVEPVGSPDITRGRGPDDERNAAGMGLTYQTQGGGKRAIALDLTVAGGADVLGRLINGADVLVENYRVGALAEHGFGYEDVRKIKSDIIYCSLTGFGQQGPRAHHNAYDNVIQATSGIMDSSGGIKTAASFVDYSSGMNAAFAIAAALVRRARDGLGVHIDCAMLDAALMMEGPELSACLSVPVAAARPREAGIACYDTADGSLMLGAFNFRQNRRLWELLGERRFADLKDWPAVWAAAADMRAVLTDRMLEKTADEWVKVLHGIGVPAERVCSLAEAAADPHLAQRPLLQEVSSETGGVARVPVASFGYSEDGPEIMRPPPEFGEHTDDLLAELGYSGAEAEALRASGAIC